MGQRNEREGKEKEFHLGLDVYEMLFFEFFLNIIIFEETWEPELLTHCFQLRDLLYPIIFL